MMRFLPLRIQVMLYEAATYRKLAAIFALMVYALVVFFLFGFVLTDNEDPHQARYNTPAMREMIGERRIADLDEQGRVRISADEVDRRADHAEEGTLNAVEVGYDTIQDGLQLLDKIRARGGKVRGVRVDD